MEPVDQRLAAPARSLFRKEGPEAGAVAGKEMVNLNSLIAQALRQAGPAAASVVLRMDELPQVWGAEAQLKPAFGSLLHYMLAQQPQPAKIYCYVKGVAMGTTLLDEKGSCVPFGVEIHASGRESGMERHLLQQAQACFNSCKIGFEYKAAPTGGMLFLLTIHGGAQRAGTGTGR